MPEPSADVAPTAPDLHGQRLHFVGIGGSGMSGLARLCAARGAIVTGSEREVSPAVLKLQAEGFAIVTPQTEEALPDATDQVVVSAAIPIDHPERAAARRRDVPVVKYAALLGRLMLDRRGVAVAGTHGKSTTTSILCHALLQSGLDPSFILGAHCEQIGGGARAANAKNAGSANGGDAASDVLIAEACEYDRSFHNFHPTHGLILNVEADHLDLYGSIDEIVESFAHFATLIHADGSLLIQHESPHRMAITAGVRCGVQTLGFAPQADWQIELDGGHVTLKDAGMPVAEWDSPMPGDHFAYNAAAAAVTAHRLGAPWDKIATAITGFTGLDRRMQLIGERGGVTLVDDYGHHPTEIDTTLRALRSHHRPTRLICVFQPHQHSRTRHLMEQFLVSFGAADVVIVPEIFFVRDTEQERQSVTAGDLVDRLRERGVKARHVHPFGAIAEQLEELVRPGDLVVTMGAGNVWQIGRTWFDQR